MAKQGQGLRTEQRLKQNLSAVLQRELGRMLEMNSAAFEEEVRKTEDENEALERVVEDTNEDNGINTKTDDNRDFKESSEELQAKDYGDDDERMIMRYFASNRSADDEYYAPTVVNEQTLYDYLMEQLGQTDISPREMSIAEFVIGNIDNNGYLSRSARAIADDVTFNSGDESIGEVDTQEVEAVIKQVQTLDPPGIAATSLTECLTLQLERRDTPSAAVAAQVVANHLGDLAAKRFDTICASLGLTFEELQHAVREILTTDPKPGSKFAGGMAEHGNAISPDFIVEVDDDNRLTLTLPNSIPTLQVSQSYDLENEKFKKDQPVTTAKKDEAAKVRAKVERATQFIKLMKMRQETLKNTMESIMLQQSEYFFTGDESRLKPMILEDVARAIDRDVSVVSRATANKYVQMPWGLKPLKFFFTEGIKSNDDGEEVSAHAVRMTLQQLVDEENKSHPLSDAALAKELMQKHGFQIARRTVTKYRKMLHIPNATLRKV